MVAILENRWLRFQGSQGLVCVKRPSELRRERGRETEREGERERLMLVGKQVLP